MGTQVKANQYCPRCKKPVAAVRTTHPAAKVFTFGLASDDPWCCPDCGKRTHSVLFQNFLGYLERKTEQRAARKKEKKLTLDQMEKKQ